jgi:arylsulfatase A-like enzyme
VFARKAADFIQRSRGRPWFIYLALHAPHTQQVDFGEYRSRFPGASKERLGVLGVMAQQDEAVGRVLASLSELKQLDDTLVFFISDNGGTRRGEGELKHLTGSLNTPFSGDKGTSLEGGIRVPFIVSWPARLPGGRTYERPVSTLDVLPTALAAARARPIDGVPLDGVNLLPFLDGSERSDPHEALFWRWRAEQAIRIGDWKLVCGREQKARRLIDLVSDAKEANDLTAQHPEKAKELLTRFDAWNRTLPPVGPSFKDTTESEGQESKVR